MLTKILVYSQIFVPLPKNTGIMTTVIIEETSAQAKKFVEYVRTLSFATIIEVKKKSFEEACAECNAVPLDTFIDELKTSVREYFNHA